MALLLSMGFAVDQDVALQSMGFKGVYSHAEAKALLSKSLFVVYHVPALAMYVSPDCRGGTGAQWREQTERFADSLKRKETTASAAAMQLALKDARSGSQRKDNANGVSASAHNKKVASLHALQTITIGMKADEVKKFKAWLYA
jgi:hypothetical protein